MAEEQVEEQEEEEGAGEGTAQASSWKWLLLPFFFFFIRSDPLKMSLVLRKLSVRSVNADFKLFF